MKIVLFDNEYAAHLKPFTYTRPIADIRIGILKIAEKWNHTFQTTCSFLTTDYLQEKFPLAIDADDEVIFIAGNVLPDDTLVQIIKDLQVGTLLNDDEQLIAFKGNLNDFNAEQGKSKKLDEKVFKLTRIWQIFNFNGRALEADIKLLNLKKQIPENLKSQNTWIGDNVYLEEGAKVTASIINSETGPVFIGKDAEIMEGSIIRGPFALCAHSVVKMGAKIYGPTTVGPYSKVGGEIGNSVIFGYSNKGHEGFLGNSVLGEWCNLGADTNNSNLKNNYGNVKLYNYASKQLEDTSLQFCGLMMGDHSKCGINTMFNTGTVVGVSANIFGSGFPPNFIPSFSWGGDQHFENYRLDKAIETAERVFDRRAMILSKTERDIMTAVAEIAAVEEKS